MYAETNIFRIECLSFDILESFIDSSLALLYYYIKTIYNDENNDDDDEDDDDNNNVTMAIG